eukprot:11363982-Alexandrium_andersonii.AAC.1
MSASLVGSEMCIRDRHLPSLPLRRRVVAQVLLASARAVTALRGARGAPVSYTHLTLPTICSV